MSHLSFCYPLWDIKDKVVIPWNFLLDPTFLDLFAIFSNEKKIANERKVIPDPIDDRKFQEWKESVDEILGLLFLCVKEE